jgi:nucleotide-binding universal stress UspA family protein
VARFASLDALSHPAPNSRQGQGQGPGHARPSGEAASYELHEQPGLPVTRLLLALDGTHVAEELLTQASFLPPPEQVEVLLLHCLDLNSLSGSGGYDQQVEEKRQRCQAYLDRHEGRLRELGYQVRSVIRIGPPRQNILETAASERVDLIVLQTHGRSGLQWLFMGSVAEGVIRRSRCPVLVLPADPEQGDPVVDNIVL